MNKLLKGFFYAVLLLIGTAYGNEQAPLKVDLVLPADNDALRALASQIASPEDYELRVHIQQTPEPGKTGDLLVVVSDKLLPLIVNSSYKAALAVYANSVGFTDYRSVSHSAIYADQPLSRQMALADAVLKGKPARIAMAWTAADYAEQFKALKLHYPQHTFIAEQILSPDSADRQINRLIQRSDVLLATPEPILYNAGSIRSILLAAYRHRTSLIGPDAGFVKAGALGSVVSGPGDYADEARQMINHFRDYGRLPPPRYPREYQVDINEHVAKSLGLDIDSARDLHCKIKEH